MYVIFLYTQFIILFHSRTSIQVWLYIDIPPSIRNAISLARRAGKYVVFCGNQAIVVGCFDVGRSSLKAGRATKEASQLLHEAVEMYVLGLCEGSIHALVGPTNRAAARACEMASLAYRHH